MEVVLSLFSLYQLQPSFLTRCQGSGLWICLLLGWASPLVTASRTLASFQAFLCFCVLIQKIRAKLPSHAPKELSKRVQSAFQMLMEHLWCWCFMVISQCACIFLPQLSLPPKGFVEHCRCWWFITPLLGFDGFYWSCHSCLSPWKNSPAGAGNRV